MYCVLCFVYCVQFTMNCVLCTVYCVLCTVYSLLCTVYCVLCTVYRVLCIYCVLYLYMGTVRGGRKGITDVDLNSFHLVLNTIFLHLS